MSTVAIHSGEPMTGCAAANTTAAVIQAHGADDVEKSPVRGWAVFPADVEERILSLLSPPEFAAVSSTCHSFQAAFKAQRDGHMLAFRRFGRERVARIGALVERCVKGEALDLGLVNFKTSVCWISADGRVHIQGKKYPCPITSHLSYEAGDIHVDILPKGMLPTEMTICWEGSVMSRADLRICRHTGVTITVQPHSDEDVDVVALAQVLLSGLCAPDFQGVARPVEVHVRTGRFQICQRPSTEPGVQAQVAPLLAYASRVILAEHVQWRMDLLVRERVRSRQGVESARSQVTLRVSRLHELWMRGWPELPGDAVDSMFAHLSLADLARGATTCSAFRAAVLKRLKDIAITKSVTHQ